MNDPNFIPHEPSYTVDEFCAAERISRVRLYELWKLGHGPRFYMNGRCRRITHAARIEWQGAMESRVEPMMRLMLREINKGPAARERGRARSDTLSTDHVIGRKPKRKLGNVWRDENRICGCGNKFKPRRQAQQHCSRKCRIA